MNTEQSQEDKEFTRVETDFEFIERLKTATRGREILIPTADESRRQALFKLLDSV